MKTFISVIDTQSGDIQYAKYYISNKEFGTRIDDNGKEQDM